MLEERRDASNRFAALDAERERIGDIKIYWYVDEDGYATEKRVGFEVGPQGSALEKLVRAYVAMGGNPFDISYFMKPSETPFREGAVGTDDAQSDGYTQPGRGMLTPLDIKYSWDQGVTDGDATLLAYRTSRGGGAVIPLRKLRYYE